MDLRERVKLFAQIVGVDIKKALGVAAAAETTATEAALGVVGVLEKGYAAAVSREIPPLSDLDDYLTPGRWRIGPLNTITNSPSTLSSLYTSPVSYSYLDVVEVISQFGERSSTQTITSIHNVSDSDYETYYPPTFSEYRRVVRHNGVRKRSGPWATTGGNTPLASSTELQNIEVGAIKAGPASPKVAYAKLEKASLALSPTGSVNAISKPAYIQGKILSVSFGHLQQPTKRVIAPENTVMTGHYYDILESSYDYKIRLRTSAEAAAAGVSNHGEALVGKTITAFITYEVT